MQTNVSICTVYIGEFRNSFSCFHTSYILTLAKVALNSIYVCCIIILYQFTEVIHNRSSVEECKLDRLLHNHIKAGIGIAHVSIPVFALILPVCIYFSYSV